MITRLFMYVLDRLRELFSITLLRRLIIAGFIIALLVMSGPFLANATAGLFFARGQYGRASSVWSVASVVSLQERDMMNANAGNALYRQGRLTEAVGQYDRALKIAPEIRICVIKWNMALTLIRLGEDNEINNIPEAIGAYSRALFQLSDDRCLNDGFFGKQMEEKAKDVKERITKLNEKAKEDNPNRYKPDPNFNEPSAEEKAQERRTRVIDSQRTGQYNERKNLDDETKNELYKQTWW